MFFDAETSTVNATHDRDVIPPTGGKAVILRKCVGAWALTWDAGCRLGSFGSRRKPIMMEPCSAIPRFFLIAAILALSAGQALSELRHIGFSDLPDPVASSFKDPFREMSFEILNELRTVARLEGQLSDGEIPVAVRPRLEARLQQARDLLDASGYDAEALLARRWTIARKRKKAMIETNPEISETEVKIAGYFIPSGLDGAGLPIGYLVEEVGMCGHTPPPPPNQLIRVKLNSALPHTSLYQPLDISGILRVEDSISTVFVLDGDVRLVSRWILDAQSVDLKK